MAEPDKDKVAETALKRFKFAFDAWATQRRREHEDLKFQVPELQWTEQARAERQGRMVNGVPSPARPMVSISKLNQPRQLIRNQRRQARLGINVHPKSPEATPETAEVIQGIIRSIEQESNADVVRGWAFDRAVDCGRGYYRLTTDLDDEGGHPFDQVIRYARILYQDMVYFDPSANQPDFSDAEFCFVCGWVSIESFRALYPDADIPDPTNDKFGFESIQIRAPEWIRFEGELKAVLVAEYFYKVHEKQTYVVLEGETVILEDLPDKGKSIPKDVPRRVHDKTSVMYCKLSPGGPEGIQHLEGPQLWGGHYIPIIPVIGEELQPFDESRQWQGLIRPNMDAQRVYNYAASTLVERMAMEPKAPFVVDPQQIEGYEAWWQQANKRNFPYLPVKRFIGANDYGFPQRAQIDASGSSLAIMGLQQINDFIQAGTFAYDPSLGQSQPQRSGKAIMAEQQQFETSSSGYLYNLADVSMQYEAKVLLDLIPVVYDRAGRVVHVLDDEENREAVMLNQPYVTDPNTDQPMPVEPGQMMMGQKPTHIDLSKGVYSVTVTVGKSFQSLRQEGSQVMGEILQARPELLPILGPLYFGFQDFPGSQEIKDLLTKMRAMQFPGLDDKPGDPAQLQAQLMQAQQQLQMMGQQMQQMQQALETKQIEQQGRMQEAQLRGEVDLQKAQIDQETKIAIAALEQKFEQRLAALQSALKRGEIQEQTKGKIAEKAADVALQPPDLTFKTSAQKPLPSGDKRF